MAEVTAMAPSSEAVEKNTSKTVKSYYKNTKMEEIYIE